MLEAKNNHTTLHAMLDTNIVFQRRTNIVTIAAEIFQYHFDQNRSHIAFEILVIKI